MHQVDRVLTHKRYQAKSMEDSENVPAEFSASFVVITKKYTGWTLLFGFWRVKL